MLDQIIFVVALLGTVLVVLASALPQSSSHKWWIRACEFPRIQIAVAALVFLCLLPFAWFPGNLILAILLLASLVWQITWIAPFTRLTKPQMQLVPRNESGSQVSIVSSNVEMVNTKYDEVRDFITETDPDIVFLMETDRKWYEALKPALEAYPTVKTELLDNYYGMIFCTRLEVKQLEVVYLTPDTTPTLFAELLSPNGTVFRVVGLHPRPPVPGNDTWDRDAALLYSARFARSTDIPLVSIGDFNDAAWSRRSRTFQRVGEYLDPRVGRGIVASFDANRQWLRIPIDQLYVTEEVAIVDFKRGPHVGSDHFPLLARIDVDREVARSANSSPEEVSEEEREEMQRISEEYRTNLPQAPDL